MEKPVITAQIKQRLFSGSVEKNAEMRYFCCIKKAENEIYEKLLSDDTVYINK